MTEECSHSRHRSVSLGSALRAVGRALLEAIGTKCPGELFFQMLIHRAKPVDHLG